MSPLLTAITAGLLGIVILRLHGHYLAFATLALQMIVLSLIAQLEFTGGDVGLVGIPLLGAFGFELSSPLAFAYLTWFVAMATIVVSRNLVQSRPGRALRALGDGERAAASSGVQVVWHKLGVFAFSAAAAGLAGGIYAFFIGYISPASFPVAMSVEFVVIVAVGGLGTVWGPVIGSILVMGLVQLLNELGTAPGMPDYAPTVLSYGAYGALLILCLLVLRDGLVPGATRLLDRKLRKGASLVAPEEGALAAAAR